MEDNCVERNRGREREICMGREITEVKVEKNV